MRKITRTHDDVTKEIQNQLLFIQNSCELFDSGCEIEAIRIATAAVVLFENRKSCNRLLRILNKNVELLSTVPDIVEVDVNKFILIKLQDAKEWYVYAFDSRGDEIECSISNLNNELEHRGFIGRGEKIFLPY